MDPSYCVPDDEAYDRELALNRAAYEAMKEEIRHDCAGKYVALAFGRLIGTAETYGDAVRLVQQLQPAPKSFEVFFADQEPLFDTLLDQYTEFI
jgi:hypothetical protein